MDAREIRLRLIEAAARNPDLRHAGGMAAGVLEQAMKWEEYVLDLNAKFSPAPAQSTLRLPKK